MGRPPILRPQLRRDSLGSTVTRASLFSRSNAVLLAAGVILAGLLDWLGGRGSLDPAMASAAVWAVLSGSLFGILYPAIHPGINATPGAKALSAAGFAIMGFFVRLFLFPDTYRHSATIALAEPLSPGCIRAVFVPSSMSRADSIRPMFPDFQLTISDTAGEWRIEQRATTDSQVSLTVRYSMRSELARAIDRDSLSQHVRRQFRALRDELSAKCGHLLPAPRIQVEAVLPNQRLQQTGAAK